MASDTVDIKAESATTNVLHYFRSYNYLFTLSAVSNSSFKRDLTATQIDKLSKKFVVARSAGKTLNGISEADLVPIKRDLTAEQAVQYYENADGTTTRVAPTLVDNFGGKSIVEEFNKNSAGRFDFYFDNFEIETIMTPNSRTGISKASSISFTIVEPYGLAGLLEALQVAAVAAGHPTYKSAPFMLKLEFIGYPDWNDVANDRPISVENATRYFIIKFSDMQIQSDENGTKYNCKAVPLSEIGFGEPNKLKTNINIEGNTVGKILKYFADELNKNAKENNKVSLSVETKGNESQADEYEILFPTVDPTTGEIDYTATNENITDKQVADLSVDNVPYAFLDPIDDAIEKNNGIKKVRRLAKKVSAQFSSRANIHDCISAIIRDSDFGVEIFSDFKNRIDPSTQLIDYFNIFLETVPKDIWNAATSQPFYTYKFYVVPYKIHYTRIPGYENDTIDLPKLQKMVRRRYDYLYTGKNKDIIKFDLKFNYLYFQNSPLREGNQSIAPGSDAAVSKPHGIVTAVATTTPEAQAKGSGVAVIEKRVDVSTTEVGQGAGETTRPLQSDPYSTMVNNLHKAILDNAGMKILEIEILGDPAYLVQNGMGNLRVPANPAARGMTVTGDVDYQVGDVYCEVTFRTPNDISKNGLMSISNVTSFSGVYRITTVSSKFNGGLFTQRLHMISASGQPNDTKQSTPTTGINLVWNGEP